MVTEFIDNNSNILNGTFITFNRNAIQPTKIDSIFNISINKVLTQKNYRIQFCDISANPGLINNITGEGFINGNGIINGNIHTNGNISIKTDTNGLQIINGNGNINNKVDIHGNIDTKGNINIKDLINKL
jgi:hypothetical protein